MKWYCVLVENIGIWTVAKVPDIILSIDGRLSFQEAFKKAKDFCLKHGKEGFILEKAHEWRDVACRIECDKEITFCKVDGEKGQLYTLSFDASNLLEKFFGVRTLEEVLDKYHEAPEKVKNMVTSLYTNAVNLCPGSSERKKAWALYKFIENMLYTGKMPYKNYA